MRPLRLQLRNFRSFAGEHTFDFDRDANLLGVVGDIGSGKSSILDGICYALFARTPTISQKENARLIHAGTGSAQVGLLLETEQGEQWEVVRGIGAGASHTLYQLGNGSVEKTFTTRKEVEPQIEQLLGLDYNTFVRTVMLPQGQFARLLEGTQTERELALRKVLGFDHIERVRSLAKHRRDYHSTEERRLMYLATACGNPRERLIFTETLLADKQAALATADELVERWNETTQTIPKLEYQKDLAEEWLGKAERLLGELSDADLARLEEQHRAVAEETARLAAVTEEKDALHEQAIVSLSAPATRTAETLESDTVHLEQGTTRLVRELENQQRQLAVSRERLVGSLPSEIERLERELVEAHQHETVRVAARLRERLIPGEECPVCAQPVPDPLNLSPVANPNGHAGAVETLAAERGRLLGEKDGLEKTIESLVGSIRGGAAQLDSTRRQILRNKAEIVELLGEGTTVVSLRQQVTRAASELDAARRRFDTHQRVVADVNTRYEKALTLRDRTVPMLPNGTIPATLQQAASELAAQIEHRREQRTTLGNNLAALRQERQKMTVSCQGSHPPQAAAALQAETQALGEETQRLRQESQKLDGFEKELVNTRSLYEMYQKFYMALAEYRMVRWLLDTEREQLALAGSKHFQRFTSGRLGIVTVGDDLAIAEGDNTRDVATLSGGEKFLASLALALGLGEMISRATHPIQCFFLDEGFGSLDAAHIEQAMNGIETMATGNQLVVVVSHLDSVKHRLEKALVMGRTRHGTTHQVNADV